MTKDVNGPAWLRAMSESEFIAAWVSELGQAPALMLDREEMIRLLLESRGEPAAAGPGAGPDDLLWAA